MPLVRNEAQSAHDNRPEPSLSSILWRVWALQPNYEPHPTPYTSNLLTRAYHLLYLCASPTCNLVSLTLHGTLDQPMAVIQSVHARPLLSPPPLSPMRPSHPFVLCRVRQVCFCFCFCFCCYYCSCNCCNYCSCNCCSYC